MKVLGIGTITPLWIDIFKNLNLNKNQLYIFDENFSHSDFYIAKKTYSYPNILKENIKYKIDSKKFMSTYSYCCGNYPIYNNNLSRFFINFNKYSPTSRYCFIDRITRKLIHIFQKENFNLVICGSPPHRVYDQIIKDICNQNKINFIYPDYQYFEEFGSFIKDINHFIRKINKNSVSPNKKNVEILNKEINSINKRVASFSTRQRVSLTNKSIASSSVNLPLTKKFLRLFVKNKSVNPIDLRIGIPHKNFYFNILRGNKSNQIGINRAKKYYYKNCKKLDKLINKKFIFFAPSYQPERSTNPDGDIYYEHYYALSIISNNIPKDTIIIYKEHPKCFDKKFKNIIYRDLNYFRKIKDNLENVFFVKDNENSIKLISNSIFTAGVNGSTGHESAFLKKRFLLFGNAQYENYPNIIKYKNIESIKEAMNNKTIKNYKKKFNKIFNGVSNLYIIRDYWRYNTKFRYGFNESFDYEKLKLNMSKDIKKYINS